MPAETINLSFGELTSVNRAEVPWARAASAMPIYIAQDSIDGWMNPSSRDSARSDYDLGQNSPAYRPDDDIIRSRKGFTTW